MATLTETEFTRIRQMIGDSHPTTQPSSSGAYDLTNPQIQAEWDRANGHSSEVAEYKAYYLMLQRRLGIWMNMVDTQTEQGTSLQSQKLKSIRESMAAFKELAGIGSFTMNPIAGTFDFGIDQDDPITGEDLEE